MTHERLESRAGRFAMAVATGFVAAPIAFLAGATAANVAFAAPAPQSTPQSAPSAATDASAQQDAPLLDPETDEPGLKVGETAPDARLVDADGESAMLADLYAEQPLVLVFYRGGWCPFCNDDLRNWQSHLDEVNDLGARLVAVSMETPRHAVETAEKNDLDYDVFVDPTGDAVRAFRLGFALADDTITKYRGYGIKLDSWNASGRWELPAPAAFVIDTDGVILFAEADWEYRERTDPDKALNALRDRQ